MGGMNHQPCNKYLPESTRLSKDLSLAYARLQMANVAIEDLLLAELDGRIGTLDPFFMELQASSNELQSAKMRCGELRKKMTDLEFVDLPTLHAANLVELGERLVDKGMITQEAWSLVSQHIKPEGFRGVLSVIEKGFDNLWTLTEELRQSAALLCQAVSEGRATSVLEENRRGNIKCQFARLFCLWASFSQVFLASSILSTELWYIYTGKPSLAPVDPKNQRNVA